MGGNQEEVVRGNRDSLEGDDECHRMGPHRAWWSVALGTGGQRQVAEGRSYKVVNVMDLEISWRASPLWWHEDPQSH